MSGVVIPGTLIPEILMIGFRLIGLGIEAEVELDLDGCRATACGDVVAAMVATLMGLIVIRLEGCLYTLRNPQCREISGSLLVLYLGVQLALNNAMARLVCLPWVRLE